MTGSRPSGFPAAAHGMTTPPTKKKLRLDLAVVARGLAESRQKAQALILAGKVRVNGVRADKAGALVPLTAPIEIAGAAQRFVSRAGDKLEGALSDFGLDPSRRTCLDVGSSTGGFTDCLLQHGAAKVFAVDVTAAQLAWRLQQDPRVTAIEANARYLKSSALPEAPSLVTVDLAFISVTKVLPRLTELAAPQTDFLILVKPQFELERGQVGRGGIVRDPELHRQAVDKICRAAAGAGLQVLGSCPSRVMGAEGNREFFVHARGPLARHKIAEVK